MADRTQENIYLYVYCFIKKDIVKGTDEQSDEEIYRVRSRRISRVGVSVPVGWGGVCHSPSVWMCLPFWKLSEPCTLGFLWRLHHVGMADREL